MDRAREIHSLRLRYKTYMMQRKWKSATLVWVRLRYLIKQQLKSENRQDARANRLAAG